MATLVQRITDLSTRIATEFKTVKASITALGTPAQINDTTPGAATTYSSNKINSQISAATAALVNSAPAALDTLAELSTALGGDAAFATTVTTSLGNRLRFDAAQTLTAPQKVQGNTNLGSAALLDTGTLDTDFVAVFNTGLV